MGRKRRCPPGGFRDGLFGSTRSGNAAAVGRIVAERKSAPDFAAVNRAALKALPALVARWLPDGRRQGCEWVARNPRRVDRRPGSFSINLHTGQWADFALADAKGGDPVSLAAYLSGKTQADAARALAEMLGVPS